MRTEGASLRECGDDAPLEFEVLCLFSMNVSALNLIWLVVVR